MKVKITYQKGEPVQELLDALKPFIASQPDCTCRTSDRHVPFYHIYLTIGTKTGESKTN